MKKQVLIVGAGFGGLSLGALLLKKGFAVTIVEKNDRVGGRARLWQKDGYSFDMGPSWYLMPEVFEDFFHELGENRADHITLEKLSPLYKVFFEGEASVVVTDDLAETRALFEGFEAGAGARLSDYLEKAGYKYEVAMKEFLYRPYEGLGDFFNRRFLTEGLRLNVLSSLHDFVKRFFSDHRAQKILEYAMVFLGVSPRRAPALYSIMSHVDLKLGVYFPRGGMTRVAQALADLVLAAGGRILLNRDVTGFRIEKGRAVAALTAEGELRADFVVHAGDYAHAETTLLEPRFRSHGPGYWRSRVMAPSMFIVFLGIRRRLEGLSHHNLYFAKDWDRHFRDIFDKPAWPENPCFYLSAITKTDPSMAPEGGENLFILVPTAVGLDDSDQARADYLERLLPHVEKVTGEDLRSGVEVLRVFSGRDFKTDYHAWKGTALGLAHTLFQTAVFRPSHKSKKVANLYYTGQYVHPGVGVPMTLIASRIVADLILRAQSSSDGENP